MRRTIEVLVRLVSTSVAATLLAVTTMHVGQLVTSAPAAHADNGLSVTNTTTYTVDPVSGVVHAQVELQLTNTLPNKISGNTITRRYFTGFSLPVPAGATNVIAVNSRGTTLNVEIEFVDSDYYFFYVLEFASNLFYQQTTNITLTYDLSGRPPRDDDPSRINAAYAAFEAYGIGDAGKTTVKVVVPSSWEVDQFGSDVAISEEGANTVYTATEIETPEEFLLFISARNDDNLVKTDVEIDGNEYEIRSWPGDTEWVEFVQTQIDDGLPILEEFIGSDWPVEEPLEIRQANTPYLYGYAGWFSEARAEIEIGEELDQETMLHELAHAWFNDRLFDERWLVEGFAEEYSNRTIDEMGDGRLQPERPSTSSSVAIPLSDWEDTSFESADDDLEEFGYNASWYVVKQITDDIGVDAMRDVLTAMPTFDLVYDGEAGGGSASSLLNTWKRFLDLVEVHGDVAVTEDVLTTYVLNESEVALLPIRRTALDEYADLIETSGDWSPPVGVRVELTDWKFSEATAMMADASEVLVARDKLVKVSTALGVDVPSTFEKAYEASNGDDFDDIVADINDQIDAVAKVQAAVDAEAEQPAFMSKIGLMGTDLAPDLEAAKQAVSAGTTDVARDEAARVVRILDESTEVGKSRVFKVVGAFVGFVLLLTLLIVLLKRRKRRRRAALVDTVDTVDTVETVDPDPSPGAPTESDEPNGVADAHQVVASDSD